MVEQSKSVILKQFVNKGMDMPKQGSNEWFNGRLSSFGGSEIASLICKNKYKNHQQLMVEKIQNFFHRPLPVDCMIWGTLFENVHKRYLELRCNTEIFEMSSIQHQRVQYHKYSPDGLCIMNGQLIKDLSQQNDYENALTNIVNDQQYIVLLEQKSPALRQVKTITTIPEYYLPQVKTGLDTIDICEIGIYTEAQFKVLTYQQLTFNGYINQYIQMFPVRRMKYLNGTDDVISRGVIIIKSKNTQLVRQYKQTMTLSEDAQQLDNMFIDFVNDLSRLDYFEHINKCLYDKEIEFDRESLFENNTDINKDFTIKLTTELDNKQNIIGIIPWILTGINYIPVAKEDKYLSKYNKLIEESHNFIEDCHKIYNAQQQQSSSQLIEGGSIIIDEKNKLNTLEQIVNDNYNKYNFNQYFK